jgi:predicted outer membrane lipoprotein
MDAVIARLLVSLKGAALLGVKVVLIVVAIMVAHAVLKAILPKRTGRASDWVMTLAAGLFIGLTYGAGAIIAGAKAGALTKRDLFLIALFLTTCHSVVEDTLLFVAVGGSFGWILGIRLVAAVAITGAAWAVMKSMERRTTAKDS